MSLLDNIEKSHQERKRLIPDNVGIEYTHKSVYNMTDDSDMVWFWVKLYRGDEERFSDVYDELLNIPRISDMSPLYISDGRYLLKSDNNFDGVFNELFIGIKPRVRSVWESLYLAWNVSTVIRIGLNDKYRDVTAIWQEEKEILHSSMDIDEQYFLDGKFETGIDEERFYAGFVLGRVVRNIEHQECVEKMGKLIRKDK